MLAAGGDDGVRLSPDGGKTWHRTGQGVPGLVQVESLAFDPADRGTLYAGTWRQAFRTRDGGASWSRIAEGMVLDATVYAWDFDAAEPRDIWVSTCGWVYRTRDGGDRWTRFTAGFTNRRSHAVRRDPLRPGVVYAATVGGLHRSSDSGATWTRVSRETLVVTALEIDRRSGRLYVGTEGEGVFYSDDGGVTLSSGSRGLAESRVAELVVDPADPSRVYFFRAFAGEESGVWEARGREVRKVSVDLLPASASLAAFRGRDGRTVLLLASSAGVRVSRDGGAHWAAVEKAPRGAPIALFGSPFASPVVVTTEGVFQTADGGGRRFEPVAGGLRTIASAELLADKNGEPLLEVRSNEALAYWDGASWSTKKKAALGGGIFMQNARRFEAGRRMVEPPGRGRHALVAGGRAAAAPSRARVPRSSSPVRRRRARGGSTWERWATGCFSSNPERDLRSLDSSPRELREVRPKDSARGGSRIRPRIRDRRGHRGQPALEARRRPGARFRGRARLRSVDGRPPPGDPGGPSPRRRRRGNPSGLETAQKRRRALRAKHSAGRRSAHGPRARAFGFPPSRRMPSRSGRFSWSRSPSAAFRRSFRSPRSQRSPTRCPRSPDGKTRGTAPNSWRRPVRSCLSRCSARGRRCTGSQWGSRG